MKGLFTRWKTQLQPPIQRLQTQWRTFRAHPSAQSRLWLRRHGRTLLSGSIYLVVAIVAGIFILYQAVRFDLLGKLPDRNTLRQVQNAEASEVFSADGQLLGRYYADNRTSIAFSDLPPHLIQALIATEDARFYKHNGVDTRSLGRVLVRTLLLNDASGGGGSTLTQQLAKNLHPRESYAVMGLVVNKFREIIIAQRLEKVHDKNTLLTLYFNTVPFGERVYGIERAAYRYFGTSTRELTLLQAATLVGMLKATTTYNPYRQPEAAQQRRNVVLRQMQRYQYLTATQYDNLSAQPLGVDYHPQDPNDGLAPYFLQYLRSVVEAQLQPYTKADGTSYDIQRDGLRIYTTLQSTWQKAAQSAVHTELTRLQKRRDYSHQWRTPQAQRILDQDMKLTDRYKALAAAGWSHERIKAHFAQPTSISLFYKGKSETRNISPLDSMIYYKSLLRAGFLVTEPHNGYIRAWVGGSDIQTLPYDNVTAQRQAGSTFKPILYAAALERGATPCTFYPNDYHQYTEFGGWTPKNADGNYGGWYTLHGGLTGSVNTVAAHLMQDVYIDSTILFAERMGIESEIPREPSIALGTSSVDLLELATVYGTIANEGQRQPLTALLRINDQAGNTIYTAPDLAPTPAIEVSTALQLRAMLESVVDSGTARSLREVYRLQGAMAGKTGTTQEAADARFVGFTPHFVGVAWVGGEYPSITQGIGSGAVAALPIWARFYQKLTRQRAYRQWENSTFPPLPPDLQYDCIAYTTDSTVVFPERRPIRDFIRRVFAGEEEQPRRPQARPKKKKGFWKRLFGND